MSRGQLDKERLEAIAAKVPDLRNLWDLVLPLSPDFVSMAFPPYSTAPIASIALADATNVLSEARYAVYEAYAHREWYKEKSTEPNEASSIFFTRFYLDDASQRLYAAGEHLASAIVLMLEITAAQLQPFEANRTSLRSIVGHYLKAKMPSHSITGAIIGLATSHEWQKTIEYRNAWVHEQPPLVDGLGIVYKKRNRWRQEQVQAGNSRQVLFFGGGDAPEFGIDDLFGFVQPALFQSTDVLRALVAFYVDLLRSRGITVNNAGP